MKNSVRVLTQQIFKLILLTGLALLLSACMSRSIAMRFNASSEVNPDANQQALPVEVKVIQLRDDLAFRNADFDDLWQQAPQALGKSFISAKSYMVLPGSDKSINLQLSKDANYIGFVAIFRTRSGYSWRVLKAIPHVYFIYPKYRIHLQGHSIEVTEEMF